MATALRKIERVCLGVLGWSYQAFWATPISSSLAAIEARREYDKANQDFQLAMWRVQVADFRNAYRGEKDAAVKPSDIVRLDMDEQSDASEITEKQKEQYEKYLARQRRKKQHGD